MGTLFLIILVFVAWTFLFKYVLVYVDSVRGTPYVTLTSTVVSLNGGSVYMVEVGIREGVLPFTLQQIQVTLMNGATTYTTTYAGLVYTSFQPLSYTTTVVNLPSQQLPMLLRPNQQYELYFFITVSPNQLQNPDRAIIEVLGTYGSSPTAFQTSAEVVYG